MTFPFDGGLNGDDPVPDEEFEDLFDDELDEDNRFDSRRDRPGMSKEDLDTGPWNGAYGDDD